MSADTSDAQLKTETRRRPILLVGGFCLLSLAVLVLLFGNRFFGRPTQAVDLPQISALNGQASGSLPIARGAPLVVGDLAHDFALENLDGQLVSLSDFRGQPVIVNFWATWCAPCRLEMPELQAAYDAHRADGLQVLALDQVESPNSVELFFDELGLTFTPLLDADGSVSDAYGAVNLPSTFFINGQGQVTAVHRGMLTESQIDEYLLELLP